MLGLNLSNIGILGVDQDDVDDDGGDDGGEDLGSHQRHVKRSFNLSWLHIFDTRVWLLKLLGSCA